MGDEGARACGIRQPSDTHSPGLYLPSRLRVAATSGETSWCVQLPRCGGASRKPRRTPCCLIPRRTTTMSGGWRSR